MTEFKNLTDLVMTVGSNSQKVLDFISDEANQRKFKRYLSFQSEETVSIPVQNESSGKETKILIAIDDGKFFTKQEWINSNGKYSHDDVVGIAVITPCVKFILGLNECKEVWGDSDDSTIVGAYNESQALQISSGYEATKQIVAAQIGKGDTAAKICWGYGHKNLQWYLPSLLEIHTVCAYKDEINELLKLVGGDLLSFDECYWSSTEHSAGYSWFVNFYSGSSVNNSKYNATVVRPAVAI